MTFRGLSLTMVTAALTAAANLLLRDGVPRFGEINLKRSRLKDGLVGLMAQPLFVFGVIFYGLAVLVWFSVLSIENLSTSYPALVGLRFIMVTVGAVFVFQESFGWQNLIGRGMPLDGIVVMARG